MLYFRLCIECHFCSATSEDNLVTKGDVSDGRHVYFRDLVGGTHYLIYAKLLRNDVPMVVPFENMTCKTLFAATSTVETIECPGLCLCTYRSSPASECVS